MEEALHEWFGWDGKQRFTVVYIERPKRDVTGRRVQTYACISKTSLFMSPSERNTLRVLGPISGPEKRTESAHKAKICKI